MRKASNIIRRQHRCTITFRWDDGDETQDIVINTPDDITHDMVQQELKKAHEYLCFEDEADTYGTYGRNPETLVSYLCESKDWTWNKDAPDIVLDLD